MAAQNTWKPHESLTTPPTNLKEAIDWVLRVTGKDGKKNEKPTASTSNGPHCLCYLAKAVKDLLYDARCPGSPGPSTDRNWDDLLLGQESAIVLPVLTDLGLVTSDSTSATSTCAGGTEVIKALIDHLALGLQKWVGWKDKGDECCLKGTDGIGRECKCTGVGAGNCCTPGSGTTCHQCGTCGTSSADNKCYLSAYCKKKSTPGGGGGGGQSEGDYYWPTLSDKPDQVHLLARIFLGSVCLIWSGLSQLGFLTKEGSGDNRWSQSKLHEIETDANKGLGSFMAAMGYDLDRLNQTGNTGKKGEDVWNLLSGTEPNGAKGIQWKEFTGDSAKRGSVAEYYSSIYGAASAAKGSSKSTEDICKQYPLLVLHILASGYFRAGSAGAKGITSPPKAAPSDPKKDNTPRKPRTIREILYWLSALPYSQGYKALVDRMKGKYPPKEGSPNETETEIKLYNEGASSNASTTLLRDNITHYLLAACGYCPLVLIGIQGTIATSGTDTDSTTGSSGAAPATEKNRCPNHSKDRNKRCTLDKKDTTAEAAPQASAGSDGKLQAGQVCYGGYHLEVSKFGPLHGMYANGLFGFDMDGSPAQCLDQLRVYVYHCFYQLYFLRKQCSVGVEVGGAGAKAVLGWNSCRYGSGVNPSGGVSNQNPWRCEAPGSGNDCQCKKTAGHRSPLMYFLCDGIGLMACEKTKGVGLNSQKQNYPEIDAHMNKSVDSNGKEQGPHRDYPQLCPVPMGWSMESKDGHFKDLNKGTHKTGTLAGGTGSPGANTTYPAHCTGRTLSYLLEYYCDPDKCHGSLVVLLRLLACITPTVPRTLGDLFGFYYYIVYIGGKSGGSQRVYGKLEEYEKESKLYMLSIGGNAVVEALTTWSNGGKCSTGNEKNLKCLVDCTNGTGSQYLSPLSGQQYGQLSPLMAGTYLSWLVYLIGEFKTGLEDLKKEYLNIQCKDECKDKAGVAGCTGQSCTKGHHGETCNATGGGQGVCGCASVVSCTGVLPVLYKYGFGYGDVETLHKTGSTEKKCHKFLTTLDGVKQSEKFKELTTSINQLIYTTRLPWIFVLTVAWLVAVLYLAFGAIWPLDWTHMRSHCRGWFKKGSLSPWEVLMVGKKKGRDILEFFGGK